MKLSIRALTLFVVMAVLAGCAGHTGTCKPDGYTLPPCPTEDSDNCYWNGGSNGQGHRFISVNGEVIYLS